MNEEVIFQVRLVKVKVGPVRVRIGSAKNQFSADLVFLYTLNTIKYDTFHDYAQFVGL